MGCLSWGRPSHTPRHPLLTPWGPSTSWACFPSHWAPHPPPHLPFEDLRRSGEGKSGPSVAGPHGTILEAVAIFQRVALNCGCSKKDGCFSDHVAEPSSGAACFALLCFANASSAAFFCSDAGAAGSVMELPSHAGRRQGPASPILLPFAQEACVTRD